MCSREKHESADLAQCISRHNLPCSSTCKREYLHNVHYLAPQQDLWVSECPRLSRTYPALSDGSSKRLSRAEIREGEPETHVIKTGDEVLRRVPTHGALEQHVFEAKAVNAVNESNGCLSYLPIGRNRNRCAGDKPSLRS